MRNSSKPRGKFVSFEGGEGSGKSSLLSRLKTRLARENIPALFSFEPGGTELGQSIREILIKPRSFFSPRAEALLYAAARAQHVEELIRPTLATGKHVIVDRFVDASLAYQGAGRGLGVKCIRDLNEWATDGLYPDRTYFLDIDPAIGLARAKNRHSLDRIESEDLSFHKHLREAYRHLAAAAPTRFVCIDAALSADKVFSLVEQDLLHWLLTDEQSA